MAELTIRLWRDPDTGKQNIDIKLHSDPDALPMEHEQAHRKLVEKLIGKGIVAAEEIGQVTVEREEAAPAGPVSNAPTPSERRAVSEGN
jgi:FtsH ternary system domain X3-analog